MDPNDPFTEGIVFFGHLSAAADHVSDAIDGGEPAYCNLDLIAAIDAIESAWTILRTAVGEVGAPPFAPHPTERPA